MTGYVEQLTLVARNVLAPGHDRESEEVHQLWLKLKLLRLASGK